MACRCGSDDLGFIDQLRGVAILAVMLAHVSQRLPLNALRPFTDVGNFGVQLFFVVSAFTLARSADRRGMRSATDVAAFYTRRLFRIVPLYWCGIALYATLALVMAEAGMPERWTGYSVGNVVLNMLLLHGVSPAANITVVHGGWSIGTEALFYAIFPALYVALVRRSWKVIATAGLVTFAVGTGVQAIQIAAGWRTGTDEAFWFSSIINQLPVFIFGMAAYRAPYVAPAVSARALAVSAAILVLVAQSPAHPFSTPAAAGAVSACLLLAARQKLRSNRWLEHVGQLSFGLYVFHFVFGTYALSALIMALPPLSPLAQTLALPVAFVGVACLSCLVAALARRWVEQPVIRLGASLIQSHLTHQGRVAESVPTKRMEASAL